MEPGKKDSTLREQGQGKQPDDGSASRQHKNDKDGKEQTPAVQKKRDDSIENPYLKE